MPTKHRVTNYTIDVDGKRVPSVVPGNELVRANVAATGDHKFTDDEVMRALKYALKTGVFKQANEPMSPLGSEFDFPQRITEQPNLFYSTGRILGGNWYDNQVAYPEQRKVNLLGRK